MDLKVKGRRNYSRIYIYIYICKLFQNYFARYGEKSILFSNENTFECKIKILERKRTGKISFFDDLIFILGYKVGEECCQGNPIPAMLRESSIERS